MEHEPHMTHLKSCFCEALMTSASYLRIQSSPPNPLMSLFSPYSFPATCQALLCVVFYTCFASPPVCHSIKCLCSPHILTTPTASSPPMRLFLLLLLKKSNKERMPANRIFHDNTVDDIACCCAGSRFPYQSHSK